MEIEKCITRSLMNYCKKKRIKYIERRLIKKDLMELYGADRINIEDWRRNRGLNMIEVSSHSKYITEKELLKW